MQGREGYDGLERSARPLSSFVIARALAGKEPGYEGRMAALRELQPVVAALPEGAPRAILLGEVAKELSLKVQDVERSFERARPEAPRPEPRKAAPRPAEPDYDEDNPPPPWADMSPSPPVAATGGPLGGRSLRSPPPERVELGLVALLLAHPPLRATFASQAAAQLVHPGLRGLCAGFADGALEEDDLLARVEPQLRQALLATAQAARADVRAPEQRVQDALGRVEELRLRGELRAAIAERDDVEAELGRADEPSVRAELEALHHDLAAQVSGLQRRLARGTP